MQCDVVVVEGLQYGASKYVCEGKFTGTPGNHAFDECHPSRGLDQQQVAGILIQNRTIIRRTSARNLLDDDWLPIIVKSSIGLGTLPEAQGVSLDRCISARVCPSMTHDLASALDPSPRRIKFYF